MTVNYYSTVYRNQEISRNASISGLRIECRYLECKVKVLTTTFGFTYYIYIYIYICVCVIFIPYQIPAVSAPQRLSNRASTVDDLATECTVRSSNLGRGKRYFSSPKRLDRLWGLPSPLFNRYRSSSPVVKATRA